MSRMLTVLAACAAAAAVGCGAIGRSDPHPDALTGRITTGGQPVKSVMVTVTGPDGAPAGGTTNDDGVYTIPNPPKGKLKFRLVAPGGGKAPFPTRYATPSNDLTFEYGGGKETYDMDLKS